MANRKRAILAVSFGTSHNDTCRKTIDVMENQIKEKYPEYPVYRAWTSGIIRRKVEARDGVHIFSVKEALEQMKQDGVEEIVVQPTHVLNGVENDLMEKDIEAFRSQFDGVAVGTPLLTTQNDCKQTVDMLASEWKLKDDEMLVFMGHGTDHHADFVYAALNYQFIINDCGNMVMGTVEGFPAIENVIHAVNEKKPKKVILTPFMIVAGDHAKNDLAGEEEDSWKRILEKEGYEVSCVLKGLGEYEAIRRIFMEHLEEAMESLE